MPPVVTTRQPTWAGLGGLVLAVKAAQEHPTRKIKRLSVSDVSTMDWLPEAKALTEYGVLTKAGDAYQNPPIGYVLTAPLGIGYAHDLADSAAELLEKRLAPKPREQPTPEQPAQQQSPPAEEKLHL